MTERPGRYIVASMAAQITHILAGEAALAAALLEQGAALPPEALPRFRLGCQGPDIFYHNQRTKPSGLHYGALAHKRRYGSLVAAAAAAAAAAGGDVGARGAAKAADARGGAAEAAATADAVAATAAGAYVLGLATHAALDRATHPFVICRAGWVEPGKPETARRRGCHAFLERLLDRELLALREGIGPEAFGLSARLALRPGAADGAADGRAGAGAALGFDRGADAGIVALWARALSAAYPKAALADHALERRVENALADGRYFFAATDPAFSSEERGSGGHWRAALAGEEGPYLVTILYPELPHAELDPMNLRKENWPHPLGGGRVSDASYPELVAAGEARAAEAIAAVLDFWAGRLGPEELAARIGEEDLSLGAAAPPAGLVCAPLALPEAMEAELAYRRARLLGPAR